MPSEIFFNPASNGERLYVLHYPSSDATPRGTVLCVQPFAEEMNKSRRMLTLQAQQLAAHGYVTLLVDLYGTGDSSGDFGEASWPLWRDDLLDAAAWLRARYAVPLWLWGVRTGALLAAQVANELRPNGLVWWSPTRSGKQYLQQFLRLRAAAAMMSGDGKGVVTELRQALASGQPVEVSGYELPAALARDLEGWELTPAIDPIQVIWLELSSQTPPVLTPAATAGQQQWRDAGHAVHTAAVTGPAFWQTTEIEVAPALLAATVAALPA